MTLNEATALRDKFYEGCTTPAEEHRLADFLGSEACPAEWADEARALLALLPEETDDLPEGFGHRLYERLRREQEAVPATAGSRRGTAKRFRLTAAWVAAAAAVAADFFLLRPDVTDSLPDQPMTQAQDSQPRTDMAEAEAYNINKGVAEAAETASEAEASGPETAEMPPVGPQAAQPRRRQPSKAAAHRPAADGVLAEAQPVATPPAPDSPETSREPLETTGDPFADAMARTRATMQAMQAECMAYRTDNTTQSTILRNHLQP